MKDQADFMAILFEQHIQNFPYFGRVQYSAYKQLVQNPSFEIYKKLQQWELSPVNKNTIKEIMARNTDKINTLQKEQKVEFDKFRSKSYCLIPSVESFTKPTKVYPEV